MAQQTINIGSAPNDNTGDPLRTAFNKTNENFTELYTAVGPDGNDIICPGSVTSTSAANIQGHYFGTGASSSNILLGLSAANDGRDTTDLTNNIIIGVNSLKTAVSGNGNIVIGTSSLEFLTAGNDNIAIGRNTMQYRKTTQTALDVFDGIISIGTNSLQYTTNPGGSMAIGRNVLRDQTNWFGPYNVGIGPGVLVYNTSGVSNTAIGSVSLKYNTTGRSNTSVGFLNLYNNVVGSYNTVCGGLSLFSNVSGNRNVATGYRTLSNTLSSQNVGVGYGAGYRVTTGSKNTLLGGWAGAGGTSDTGFPPAANQFSLITGHNNTVIGYGANPTLSSVSNEITLGNGDITTLRCNATSITSLSDKRDKTDIKPLNHGLHFINKLNPVTFKWDRREWYIDGISTGEFAKTTDSAGFIAQELQQVSQEENAEYLNLVYDINPDRLEASIQNLIPPMVKSIQELAARVSHLEEQVEVLTNTSK